MNQHSNFLTNTLKSNNILYIQNLHHYLPPLHQLKISALLNKLLMKLYVEV